MTANSLSSFIPFLSEALQRNPSALYERLRALVRLDLLKSEGGRGPGKGVRLTPDTLATFLISLMATDNIADAGDRTAELSEAPLVSHTIKRANALAGAKTFKSALINILTDAEVAEQYAWLRINRGEVPSAEVFIWPTNGSSEEDDQGMHLFCSNLRKTNASSGMISSVTLRKDTVVSIRERLTKVNKVADTKSLSRLRLKPTSAANRKIRSNPPIRR